MRLAVKTLVLLKLVVPTYSFSSAAFCRSGLDRQSHGLCVMKVC